MNRNNSVDSITFNFNTWQIDDFIIKAAELEKEGYRITTFTVNDISYSQSTEPEAPYHVTFTKR